MSSCEVMLSALVVAHNEEARLAECLETLRFCDEIVVVLDGCTDRSKEIALEYTDRIVEGAWPLEGPRRRAGADALHLGRTDEDAAHLGTQAFEAMDELNFQHR